MADRLGLCHQYHSLVDDIRLSISFQLKTTLYTMIFGFSLNTTRTKCTEIMFGKLGKDVKWLRNPKSKFQFNQVIKRRRIGTQKKNHKQWNPADETENELRSQNT